MSKLLKLLCLACLPLVAPAENYCSLCEDHTMCKFTNKSPACGADSESGVSPDEAREIVNLHNEYRAKIANGQETRGRPGPQPPAGNMQALVWDDKLAEVAQRWADQCTFQHDQCRNDPRFNVGQNIYWSTGFPTVNWTRAVAAWYNEVKDFSAQNAGSFKLDSTTGHYTQIAWATTTHIGCARTTYGGSYRLQGYRPREFVLATSPLRKVAANRLVKRQGGAGFFGGATFDSAGGQGAVTGSSGGWSRPPNGNRPTRPTGGNFPSHDNGGNNQDNPGFFGGATSDPAGAQGAVTGSSGGMSGPMRPTGGNFPSYGNGDNNQDNPGFFGGATSDPAGAQGAVTGSSGGGFGPMRPTGGNFPSHGSGSNGQDDSGFFGGATFDPAGGQGAVTGSSGEGSGPSNGNRPVRPTGGNFPSNGNHPSNPSYPSFPDISIEDYPTGPSYPSVPGISEGNGPSNPSHPNFPDISVEDYPTRPSYPSVPGISGGNGPSNPSHPIFPDISVEDYPTRPSYPSYLGTNDLSYSNYPNYPSHVNEENYPTYQDVRQNYLGDLELTSRIYTPHGPVPVDNEDSSHEWFGINALVKNSYSFVGRDQILICNYGPAGNWRGEPLYTKGNACSLCPSGTTCNGGLCVPDRMSSD